MKIIDFSYDDFNDSITVYGYYNSNLTIYLNDSSGKLVYRYKIGFPSNAQHPGIVVGEDIHGVRYILHNHRDHGCAVIENEFFYAKGMEVQRLDKVCDYPHRQVLENGLNEAILCRPYNWLENNCQVYVNRACNNTVYSESVQEWKPVMAVAGIFILLALLGGSR